MTLSRIAALASDRRVHRAFHWLHLHELQLRQWQLQMIAIPAPPFAEAARAAWFLSRFRDLGLSNVHLDAEGNALGTLLPIAPVSAPVILSEAVRGTLRTAQPKDLQPTPHTPPHPNPFRPEPLPQTPCVLLSAHLDTVFPSTTDCTPREDGPRILAPGACDNAAGLTALLAIAAAVQHAQLAPPCPVLFAANVGEEGPGDLRGMRHLFAGQHHIAAAIALEGSGNATVVDRGLGSRRLRVTLTGPGGHSWADAAQPNPIFLLAEALAALSRLNLPSSPRTTLQAGTISGGTSVNSIPASATADIDIRSGSAETLLFTEAEALLTLRTAIHDAHDRFAPPDRLTLQIDRIGDRPAAILPPHSPLLASLRATDRHLGIATESRMGSTDANLPLSLGIPALAIGAGGTAGGIHTLNEWYDPTGRDLALRRILLHLLDTCTLMATNT